MEKSIKKWNRDNAAINIERYCAYQERCHDEVRTKLLSHGIYGDFLEELISDLIQNNFLNEERFAVMYAGGKFRIKRWGRIKIQQALKQKGVSSYSVRVALENIKDEDYAEAIRYWIQKRGNGKTDFDYEEKNDMVRYILSKGFETDWIIKILNELK
ncbi:MAG: RecX family transcriptional regulator [Saprospiraceae bacterium]|nr:RecX family transcriptional regulator [Saprospiraceae bacterium]